MILDLSAVGMGQVPAQPDYTALTSTLAASQAALLPSLSPYVTAVISQMETDGYTVSNLAWVNPLIFTGTLAAPSGSSYNFSLQMSDLQNLSATSKARRLEQLASGTTPTLPQAGTAMRRGGWEGWSAGGAVPLAMPMTTLPATAVAATAPAAQGASTFSFLNLTSGNAAVFNIGDVWQVTITGPVGAAVSYVGGLSGQSSTVLAGTIPSSGTLVLTGSMDSTSVGTWVESWYVGSSPVASFSFVVQQAATVIPMATSDAQTALLQAGGTLTPVTTTVAATSAATTSSIFGTDPTTGAATIFGMSETTALLIAGALVVAYFMLSGGKEGGKTK